jgi:hypothetical protein
MVGVSAALHLQGGRDVALIDRRDPGEETSYGNAGLIQREAVIPLYLYPERPIRGILDFAPGLCRSRLPRPVGPAAFQKPERRKEELPMAIAMRPIEPADVPEAGRICHDAFKAIVEQHNFPPDFPEPDVAINLLSRLTANLGFYGVVAEQDGRIVGSNFVDERSPIIGLGPITVDPATQNQGVGTALE